MKLNDVRVSRKVWGTILGLLMVMLAVAGFTLHRAGDAMDKALADVERQESLITLATEWRGLSMANNERTLALLMIEDETVAQLIKERRDGTSLSITDLQKKIVSDLSSEFGMKALEAVNKNRAAMVAVRSQSDAVKGQGDAVALRDFAFKELDPSSRSYVESLDYFVQVTQQDREDAKEEAMKVRRNVTLLGLLSAALVVGAAMVLALLLVRSITRPLAQAVSVARAISEGDLTQNLDVDRQDEFGQLLKALSEMSSRLRGLVTEVRSGVESVSTASAEIANGNQDLSARTEQTAANLEETAASMEQLTVTVTQSADTARQANQLAANAAQAAERGGEVVSQVVHSMQQITDSSKRIADIIGVIDGIAFQTNILALNAAVEAARAGEQGRGFAVVAGEVRNLAQRSAEAAKEIKGLITASVDNVEAGSAQVSQAGTAMGEIVGSVRRVSDLIGEITASSTEQRDGIGQVNQAVTNLDQMTQQNAALVEESAAAAAALQEQAQRLSEVVSVFNVGHQTGSAPRAPAVATAPRPVTLPSEAAPKPRTSVAGSKAAATQRLASPATSTKPQAADDEWESF
jgi:methyl-accepting chemotaxis protein